MRKQSRWVFGAVGKGDVDVGMMDTGYWIKERVGCNGRTGQDKTGPRTAGKGERNGGG